MNNPFLNTIPIRLFYTGIWVIVIISQILLFQSFTFYGSSGIVYDSLITNSLQAVCILLLWYPVRYYRDVSQLLLFLSFHFLLLLFSLAIWLGLGYLLTKLCFDDSQYYRSFFLTVLPFRIVFGVVLYILFVLVYYLFMANREIREQRMKADEISLITASGPVEKLSRIAVKKNKSIHFIPVDQIHYIEANGDYVFIYTDDGRYLENKTMKYWETHLPDDLFVRIHRSFIVNLEQVCRVELYEKETYRVYLKNNAVLKASNKGGKILIKN